MTSSFIPHPMPRVPPDQLITRGREFLEHMDSRRSVRDFSDEPVPREAIELAITAASTAPSGAHRQPWKFVVVGEPELKRSIRIAAEEEEYENYEGGRIPPHWREALEPLGTDWRKPFLETAPWLVVVFEERFGRNADGSKRHNFYVKESVGIACGIFITALHTMGLATLTHTPSPMSFLARVLERPDNERPYILLPVGYPATDALVPDLDRKPLEDVMVLAGD